MNREELPKFRLKMPLAVPRTRGRPKNLRYRGLGDKVIAAAKRQRAMRVVELPEDDEILLAQPRRRARRTETAAEQNEPASRTLRSTSARVASAFAELPGSNT